MLEAKLAEYVDVPVHLAQAAHARVDAHQEVGPEELDREAIVIAELLADDDAPAWRQRVARLRQQ